MKPWQKRGGILLLLLLLMASAVLVARRPPALPNPNGYDRLLALAETIPNSVKDLPSGHSPALAEFALGHSNLIAEAAAASALPARIPVEYSQAWLGNRTIAGMSLRRLERAVLACAHYHESISNRSLATTGRLAVIRLGQQGTRGGLMVDFMIGSAIQMHALTEVANSSFELDAASCQVALQELAQLQAGQEPLSAYASRERRWMLVGSEWWRDWDQAKQLPGALLKPTEGNWLAGSPATRNRELQQAYAATETALRRRLAELDSAPKPDARR